ncbi:MAG: hypothetical protein LBQ57_13370 [Spirochaetales bacterium]|jgi:hypothetical protein|nr:hypothetical protein [Spirochaetales bacterium]
MKQGEVEPIVFGAEEKPEGVVYGAEIEVEKIPHDTIIYGVNEWKYADKRKPGECGFASELLKKWLP